ncbi:hypothetical protein HUG15_15900 [Salicibibacter cibarius]|uniref:Uncharacterized protein n=1 Tax=Salicibibacter cibarius TaxID=2743000 RepID=A0A7T6Z4M0_9BACI|nr:hypothetical protein HUG15_15900 [Salicibibacter cibarius]
MNAPWHLKSMAAPNFGFHECCAWRPRPNSLLQLNFGPHDRIIPTGAAATM